MKKLELYERYSREDVHDIFSPNSKFSEGAGTWGIHGVVKIPTSINSYVFFITFGQAKLGHAFDEQITESGILTWQSQPKQTLQTDRTKNLINHNHQEDNIYIFLRTKKTQSSIKKPEPFTYLGRAAYITHDFEREEPVHFKWQLLDLDAISNEVLERMNLKLISDEVNKKDVQISGNLLPYKNSLIESPKPKKKLNENGVSTRDFRGRINNFEEIRKKNSELGLKGELLVLQHLKTYLIENGRGDFADKIIHTSKIIGDGTGFDIQSYDLEGKVKYIEVKTTRKGAGTPFTITTNELAFSKEYSDSYILYRIYNYDDENNVGNYYIAEGEICESFNLTPTEFKVTLK